MANPVLRTVTPPSDAALVERAVAGDEQAFAAIYRRHAGSVAAVVYRLLGRDGDLDDIVQETFVEGLKGLAELRDPDKLRSFLITIAVRRIHARLSFRYRMKSLAAQLFGVAPSVSDPDAELGVHALYQALALLPAKQRIAWVLHRMEGYTFPEVADHTGASLATIKRWVQAVDQALEANDATP